MSSFVCLQTSHTHIHSLCIRKEKEIRTAFNERMMTILLSLMYNDEKDLDISYDDYMVNS